MSRLTELYKLTSGGHALLSESDFAEYSKLRKVEFQERKAELENEGKTNIKACKDASGDIIGFMWIGSESRMKS